MLPVGHGCIPQYCIFTSDRGETYVSLKPECIAGGGGGVFVYRIVISITVSNTKM